MKAWPWLCHLFHDQEGRAFRAEMALKARPWPGLPSFPRPHFPGKPGKKAGKPGQARLFQAYRAFDRAPDARVCLRVDRYRVVALNVIILFLQRWWESLLLVLSLMTVCLQHLLIIWEILLLSLIKRKYNLRIIILILIISTLNSSTSGDELGSVCHIGGRAWRMKGSNTLKVAMATM